MNLVKSSETSENVTIDEAARKSDNAGIWQDVTTPVLIPVKDMLGISVGFTSLYDSRYVDFDETYRDILTLAFLQVLRQPLIQIMPPH